MRSTIDLPFQLSPDRVPAWFLEWRRVRDSSDLLIRGMDTMTFEPANVTLLATVIAQRNADQVETRIELDELELQTDGMSLLRCACPPLRPICSEGTAGQIARECDAILQERMPALSSSVRRSVRNVLEELGVNVVRHSGAPEKGFVIAQVWPNRPQLQIAAADAGVGFLASVRRHVDAPEQVEGEGEALQLALHTGLTSSSSRDNSGLGLGMLRDLSDKLGANLWLASGTALLHRRTVAGQRVNTVHSTAGWNGSWICMDASLDAA